MPDVLARRPSSAGRVVGAADCVSVGDGDVGAADGVAGEAGVDGVDEADAADEADEAVVDATGGCGCGAR